MFRLNIPKELHSPKKRKSKKKRDFIYENKERVRLMTLGNVRSHVNFHNGEFLAERCNTKLDDIIFKVTSSNTRIPITRGNPKLKFTEAKNRKKKKRSVPSIPNSRRSIDSKQRAAINKSSTEFMRKFLKNVQDAKENRKNEERKRLLLNVAYTKVNTNPKIKQSSRNNKPKIESKFNNLKPQAPNRKTENEKDYKFVRMPFQTHSISEVSKQETGNSRDSCCQWTDTDRSRDAVIRYPTKYSDTNTSVQKESIVKKVEPARDIKNEMKKGKSDNEIVRRKLTPQVTTTNKENQNTIANSKELISISPVKHVTNKMMVGFERRKIRSSGGTPSKVIEEDARPPPAEPISAPKKVAKEHPKPHATEQKEFKPLDPIPGLEKVKKSKAPPGLLIPEDERLRTLKMLQTEFCKVWKQLKRIPAKCEDINYKVKKIRLEEDLRGLEKNIKTYSFPKVYVC